MIPVGQFVVDINEVCLLFMLSDLFQLILEFTMTFLVE